MQPIRTASEIEAHIKILPVRQIPLYQKHAQKATELHLLGMTQKQIAKTLNVSLKTIKHALKYYPERAKRVEGASPPVDTESAKAPHSVIPEFPEGKYPGSTSNKKRKET